MRAYTPGGRFDSDFELDSIGDGITADLTNPAGTKAQWWIFNSAASVRDPIYDVEPLGGVVFGLGHIYSLLLEPLSLKELELKMSEVSITLILCT